MSKNIIFVILSAVTTVVVFSYLFSTISLFDVKQVLKETEHVYIVAFVILSLFGSCFRTWRDRLTLRSSGYQPKLLPMYLITLVRNLFSDLLPARIGTTIYIYLINSRLGVPVAVATNSWALALLFDMVALGPLVIIGLLFTGADFPLSKTVLFISAAIILILTFIVVQQLPLFARIAAQVIRKINILPKNLTNKLAEFTERVGQESLAAKTQGTYFNIFLASIFVRLCKYGSLYVFLVGILVPLGFEANEVNPIICSIGILAAELAASLPISGIAGFGAYEGAWAFTFSLLGFPGDIAKLTAFAHHLFTQLWGYGIGLLALTFLMLPFYTQTKNEATIKPLKRISDLFAQSALFVLCLCLLFVVFETFPKSKKVYAEPEQPVIEVSAKSKLAGLASNLPGRIYFDSNRSGTFGIYSINTDGTALKLVVDQSNWHETYPDISPDGKLLAFARTRSLVRQAPSEVWIANIDGSNARKISENASFPTFSGDSQRLFLEVNRSRVEVYDLRSGKSKSIFPGKRSAFKGRQIVKPRVSPDESAIAVTVDNPTRWHAWIAPLQEKGKADIIAPGCEPTWFPDSNKIAWMKKTGAKAGSGIMYFDKKTKQKGVLKDDPGPLGHEYFPTVTSDGNYLLYAASPENQHDHLTSNYNIFVYDIAGQKTWQLTFDGATNRWPKYLPEFAK